MMNSREILEFITDNEKVTLSKLSQLMGIKRAQPLYDIRDGKIKAISANYADKILSVFPEYSRVWLITGEGQPFSKNENEENIGESIIMAASERFLEVMEGLKIGPYVLEKDCGVKNAQAKINKIEEYDSHCTFESMDKSWLENFEAWMAKTMKVNAYAIHLRNIRTVFNYAIDEEYTTLYPFRRFSIKKEETRKRSLTAEQLRLLRDYPCEEYQIRYRDMFMLMFYLIGVNAADLFNAKHSALVNGRFEYKRAKTGKLYSIKVEPEAQVIIEKYKGKDYLLNIMDEYGNYKDFLHRMGIGLKQIGETERKGLGGKKSRNPLFPDLSSYWARHTWATVAAELDVPKEVIAHALGHSWANSTTTDIYVHFDMRKVDKANRKVIDYVNVFKK